ncbi:MAG: hypothetical protein RL885_02150, partial [Planctomycetota bacterium]
SFVACCGHGDDDSGGPPTAQSEETFGTPVWTMDDVDQMVIGDTPVDSLSHPGLARMLRSTRDSLTSNNRHRPLPGQGILPIAWSGATVLSCDGLHFRYQANCSPDAEVFEAEVPNHRDERVLLIPCVDEKVPARIEFVDLHANPEQEPGYARRASILAALLEDR